MACWAAQLRAQRQIDAGVSSSNAATADDGSDVFGKKGGDNSLTLVPLILLRLAQMGRVDHEFRQRAAEAIMDTFGQFDAVRRR